MPKFKLYRPKPGATREERDAFVTNMYALRAAFTEKKVDRALVRLTRERWYHCDNVRPVGVWTADNLDRAFIGFSPHDTSGELRDPTEDLIYVEFSLK